MNLDVIHKFKQKLVDSDAIKNGHFILSNGDHSPVYFQMAKFCQNTVDNNWACTELVKEFGFDEKCKALDVQLIVSPAIGGITVGYELASILEIPFMWCERTNGKMELRRGFEIKPGTRVGICEDVVTTLASVNETRKLIEECGGEVVVITSLVNRSGKQDKELTDVPYFYLMRVDIKTSKPDECNLCEIGIPAYKPGSNVKK